MQTTLEPKIIYIDTSESFLFSQHDLIQYNPIYAGVSDCVPITIFLTDGKVFTHHANYKCNIECIPSALEALGITKDNTERIIIGGGNEIEALHPDCYDNRFVGQHLKTGIQGLLNKYFNEEIQIEVQPPLGCGLNLSLDCTKQGEYNAGEYSSRLNSPFEPESAKFAFNTPHKSYLGCDLGRPSVFNEGEEHKKNTYNTLNVRIFKSDSKTELLETLKPFAR